TLLRRVAAALLFPLAASGAAAQARASSAPGTPNGPANARAAADVPPPLEREFRAAWVATVANIDWPSRPGLSSWQQQAELIAILDRAVELELNAVILQVRPAADALYRSSRE